MELEKMTHGLECACTADHKCEAHREPPTEVQQLLNLLPSDVVVGELEPGKSYILVCPQHGMSVKQAMGVRQAIQRVTGAGALIIVSADPEGFRMFEVQDANQKV